MEFSGDTISEAWELSITELLKCSEFVPSERGMKTIELCNVLFKIKHPDLEPKISSKYCFDKNFIEAYSEKMKEYWKSIKERLFSYGKNNINQINTILNTLNNCWYSRRTFVSTWDPNIDFNNSHPPCPVGLQFMIRNNQLNLTAFLRSNDAWMCAIPDMIELSKIQKEISFMLGVDIGSYNQLSVSYHIYEPDLIYAKEVFV